MRKKERRREPRVPIGSPLHQLMEYSLLIIGSFLVALSFNWFLNPNRIATGGVVGISTIIDALTGIEPAVTQWVLNIPLFVAGLFLLGGRFGMKTLVGSIVLPLFVLLTGRLQPLTDNLLLATIYGGIGIGVGLGLVFRGRASTGGLDLAAQILHKYTGLSLGYAIAVLDGLVILAAGLIFSPEKALYALIGLFVTSKTINIVQIGFSRSKVAFIISDRKEEIKKAILYELDRGLTELKGQGGYTGESREILMVVVDQIEVNRMKAIVKTVDRNAFIIISDTTEVLGEGFKLSP
jgi:uncharacterized membrane-anchored protein YitT (DUF2179 family)